MGLRDFAHNLNMFIFCSYLFSCILYSTQVLRVIAFVLEFSPYEHIFERLHFCVRYYWLFWEIKVELGYILQSAPYDGYLGGWGVFFNIVYNIEN